MSNLYGDEIFTEAYQEQLLIESVEQEIRKSGNNIDRLLSKINLTRKDVDVAKNFISKNGLLSSLKRCKSLKDIRAFMKSKEYKDALEKETKNG